MIHWAIEVCGIIPIKPIFVLVWCHPSLTYWSQILFNAVVVLLFIQILTIFFNQSFIQWHIMIWKYLKQSFQVNATRQHYQSLLVQVAQCCQTTSHYLNQYWPSTMASHGVNRPQSSKQIINVLQIRLDFAVNLLSTIHHTRYMVGHHCACRCP